jgi:hypothetical protein
MVYEYTEAERFWMAIITGSSNFASIPPLLLMYFYERHFEFYIGLFTIITSFFYHVCESLDCIFYMEQKKWHVLDNIGSICCLNSLIISLTNSYRNHQQLLKYNLFSLFFVMILQANDPWDLFNTILPIVIFVFILLYDYLKYGIPKYNKEIMLKGSTFLIVGFSMFIKGLDDLNDYLRIAHSIWHITIGFGTFYLWQIQEHRMITFKEVFKESYIKIFNNYSSKTYKSIT